MATLLENLSSLAAGRGHLRTRTGPRDSDMRAARVCYNHLAGARAVQLYDSLSSRGALTVTEAGIGLTDAGAALMETMGLDLATLHSARPPLCRECLDWSERRTHLGGRLGRALLTQMEALNWLRRDAGSRVVRFTPPGLRAFDAAFPPLR